MLRHLPNALSIARILAAPVLVALAKWVQLALIPMPSEKEIQPLLKAMLHDDHTLAMQQAGKIKGWFHAFWSISSSLRSSLW